MEPGAGQGSHYWLSSFILKYTEVIAKNVFSNIAHPQVKRGTLSPRVAKAPQGLIKYKKFRHFFDYCKFNSKIDLEEPFYICLENPYKLRQSY